MIDDRKAQVKPAQHFHQPLVNERVGHHHQYPARQTGVQLVMEDQAGLDGLAQAHLIRQEHSRRVAAGHLMGDVQLVR